MQKLIGAFCISFLFILTGCHSREENGTSVPVNSTEAVNIFPVTSFIKAQLKQIDSMAVTPLKITSENGKSDSSWLKREAVRNYAREFLTPVIDSANMSSLFSEKSFLDQTINAFTFSYDPKVKLPGSIKLTHWDVYMNPQTNKIERIYLVKQNADTIKQLTWVVNKWYSVRTITKSNSNEPGIKEDKLIWDFDD
jgi:hypothetical protein